MSNHARSGRRLLSGVALAAAVVLAAGHARAQAPTAAPHAADPVFTVDGRLALHALVALGDGHLREVADVLTLLAATDAARSTEWERVRAPLADAARLTVPAVLWFARPDGGYWTVAQGRAAASLADRPYFARLLKGETVIGDLVLSRATNRSTAVVAVPVRGRDGAVVGALGASVHLDSLSALIREELGGLAADQLFFASAAPPLGALNSDSTLIFAEPMKLGDEGMRRAFRQLLAGREGVVTYDFRGGQRTVLYRRSPVTGWWYGFGVIRR